MPIKKTNEKGRNLPERTLKKQKARKRKIKRNIFFYAIIFTILVVAISVSSLTIFFNIREIHVIGESKYSNEQIINAAGLKIGQNMFRLNKFEIQKNVVEKLPYISEISISRKLPDILEIKVVKANDFAAIVLGTGFIKIDENSKSLEVVDENTENLIEIKNVKVTEYTQGKNVKYEEEGIWEKIKSIIDALKATETFDKINYIDLEKNYDIVLNYENRIDCYIGDTEKIDIKLLLMKNVISQNPPSDQAIVDVKDSSKAYYRLKETQ